MIKIKGTVAEERHDCCHLAPPPFHPAATHRRRRLRRQTLGPCVRVNVPTVTVASSANHFFEGGGRGLAGGRGDVSATF